MVTASQGRFALAIVEGRENLAALSLGGPPATTLHGVGSARVDVPYRTLPSTFGAHPMASSKMRTAQSVTFGSGVQHGSPAGRGGGGSGPDIVELPKSKLGGLFSGGGGIPTQSLRPKGLAAPGPAGLPNESLVKPSVLVPRLGRSDRWGTAEYLEKSRRGAGADRVSTPISGRLRLHRNPSRIQIESVDMGVSLGSAFRTRKKASFCSRLPPRPSNGKTISSTTRIQPVQRTGSRSNLSSFSGFGFGCSMEEHVKYGCCLDGSVQNVVLGRLPIKCECLGR